VSFDLGAIRARYAAHAVISGSEVEAILAEVDRLAARLATAEAVCDQVDAYADALGLDEDVEIAAWNRLVDLIEAWREAAGR